MPNDDGGWDSIMEKSAGGVSTSVLFFLLLVSSADACISFLSEC